DRESVVEGKSVDLRGRRILKKKKETQLTSPHSCRHIVTCSIALSRITCVFELLRSDTTHSTRNITAPTSISIFFFFKQKTAYEIQCDWSSDVCSSDLHTHTHTHTHTLLHAKYSHTLCQL